MAEWTKERHEAAAAREKAATPGPWKVSVHDCEAWVIGPPVSLDHAMPERDASFIVGARNDAADMLAKIEALTAQLGKLRETTSTLCDAVCNLDHYEADDPEGPDLMQALGAAQDACASSPAPAVTP